MTFVERLTKIVQFWEVKVALAGVGTFCLEAIGDNTLGYQVLYILVFIDLVTGIAKGMQNGNVSSRRLSRSVGKILLYSSLVLSAHQLTRYMPVLRWAEDGVILFLAVTEFVSIAENAKALGIPIPQAIMKKLEKYLDSSQER